MTAAWAAVVLVGLGSIAIKAAGPLLLGDRELPPRLQAALDHLAPAMLAALVVTGTLAQGQRLVLDPRLAGLAAAAVALALRANLVITAVAAALAAAVTRLLT